MSSPNATVTIKPMFLAREEAATFLSISSSMLEKLAAKAKSPSRESCPAGERLGWWRIWRTGDAPALRPICCPPRTRAMGALARL